MNNKLGMSMVLTCYNREKFIKKAILSCFAQDYDGPMQLIIVDDASTDGSLKIIQETVEESGRGWDVEIISLPENRGVAGATDAGWARAKHEWILIIDGDDVQRPNRCQLTADIATRITNLGQVSFCMQNIDEAGQPFSYAAYGRNNYENTLPELIIDTPKNHFLNAFGRLEPELIRSIGAATAFHRSLWDKWGPLCQDETENMRFEQDPTWAFRAALSMTAIGSKAIALDYRTHSSNLSNITLQRGIAGIIQFEKHQEKYQDFHANSLVCMLQDIERAIHDRSLTNWPEELLVAAREKLEYELAGCRLRSMWWSASYRERLSRAIKNWRIFRKSGTSPLRLLPFSLFCRLKYWKQKREWSKR